jgi:hypothetical protein
MKIANSKLLIEPVPAEKGFAMANGHFAISNDAAPAGPADGPLHAETAMAHVLATLQRRRPWS